MLYCSGSMCVGVTVWFGSGGVVSLCRLKHYSAVNSEIIKQVTSCSSVFIQRAPILSNFLSIILKQLVSSETLTDIGGLNSPAPPQTFFISQSLPSIKS